MTLLPRHTLFDLDNAFDHLFTPVTSDDGANGVFSPRVDIAETEQHYRITAEMPGVKKQDIHLSIDHGVLRLEAESRFEHDEKADGKVVRQERRYGKLVRSFNLGPDVESSDVDASFAEGILTLTVPKKAPAPDTTRSIEIH